MQQHGSVYLQWYAEKAMNIDNVFGMAYQAPITTAYTLWIATVLDIYDEPEKLKILLGKLIRI